MRTVQYTGWAYRHEIFRRCSLNAATVIISMIIICNTQVNRLLRLLSRRLGLIMCNVHEARLSPTSSSNQMGGGGINKPRQRYKVRHR